MIEQWLPIKGYEYEISNMGRARSITRKVMCRNNGTRTVRGRILKPRPLPTGYLKISISRENIIKDVYIHRLVATAFTPNPHKYKCINHKDGIKSNNIYTNLEWCTYKMNTIHAYKTGLSHCGEKHGNSKLNAQQVRIIRHLKNIAPHMTQSEIGKIFNIAFQTVSTIQHNKSWKHNRT